jgi:hypothetical protein
MSNEILSHALTLAIILIVGSIVIFGGAGYLWNKQYIPNQANKGKLVKPFGRLMSEVNNYTFKEDNYTFAKKSSPKVQKIFSMKSLHVLLLVGACVGYVLTGNFLFFLLFPLSFSIGLTRAMKVLQERTKTLTRIFAIASSTIRFSAGTRGKNAPPVAYWNFIEVKSWNPENPVDPLEMIITFPAGQGPDYAAQNAFDKTFTQHVTDEHDWFVEWDLTHDQVTIKSVPKLPTKLLYPGSKNSAWSVFPVGLAKSGEASYDVSTFPHALVGGPSGTGKSVLQRNIVFHTIQHNDRWRFIGIDLKRVELVPYNKYKKTVIGVATDVAQGLEVLKYAYNQMMDRYEMMEKNEVTNLMEMEDPPYCILLMIDEATMFLGASGSKTEEGKAEDMMKGEASDLVGKILRLGRAAGIHMIIAMQRPDATVLRGEFKANMDVRLAAGRMDSTPSSMLLDSGEAVTLPGIRGRGIIRVGGGLETFQGYFAAPTWIDEFILENPEIEPSTIAPGGHLYTRYQEYQQSLIAPASEEVENVEEEEQPKKRKLALKEKIKSDKPPKEKKVSAKQPDEETEKANITPAPVAVAFDPNSYSEPELPEAQQQLLTALATRSETVTEQPEERAVPTFFTGSDTAVKQQQQDAEAEKPVLKPLIEPDLDLKPEDFILDDFDDLDDDDEDLDILLSESEPELVPAPEPEPEIAWASVSPFGKTLAKSTPAKPAAIVQKPVAKQPENKPVTPAAEPVSAKPFTAPAKPATMPVKSPFPAKPAAAKPERPSAPARPGAAPVRPGTTPVKKPTTNNPFSS